MRQRQCVRLSPRKSETRNSKIQQHIELGSPDHGKNANHRGHRDHRGSVISVSSVAWSRFSSVTRILCFGFFLLVLASQPAGADEATREPQIVETEKQIQLLNKKLEELRLAKANEPAGPAGTISPEWIKTMTWRCIGPAAMSGRII